MSTYWKISPFGPSVPHRGRRRRSRDRSPPETLGLFGLPSVPGAFSQVRRLFALMGGTEGTQLPSYERTRGIRRSASCARAYARTHAAGYRHLRSLQSLRSLAHCFDLRLCRGTEEDGDRKPPRRLSRSLIRPSVREHVRCRGPIADHRMPPLEQEVVYRAAASGLVLLALQDGCLSSARAWAPRAVEVGQGRTVRARRRRRPPGRLRSLPGQAPRPQHRQGREGRGMVRHELPRGPRLAV